MALQFTDQTAREAIESGKPVVIDFWATWCGPCIKLGPVVEELADKYPDVQIGKLNIDENDEIAGENRVRNIFKNGSSQRMILQLVVILNRQKVALLRSESTLRLPVFWLKEFLEYIRSYLK